MRSIVFLTPGDARDGFALTGMNQVMTTPEALGSSLCALTGDPSVGVLAVDERLLDHVDRRALHDLERRSSAVIVVVPPPSAEGRVEDDYIRRLIRAAIGYQVRVDL